jgi:hypothetical protein
VFIKRLNYFTHQFLREKDFKDEQAYHLDMRHRHNQVLHGWGVVVGLEVHKKGEREITINAGTAIDKEGRELILTEPVSRDLSSFEPNSHTYITLAYAEVWQEADRHSAGGVENYTRVTESPEISERRHQPPADGSTITLARVHLNDVGHVHQIDMDAAVRKHIARLAAGWVRLPFKPTRLSPLKIDGRRVRIGEQEAETYEFIVDEATAYCDEKGARGSMQIPVPPAATKIVGFRIAGTARGNVVVHLWRTGWNLHENKGENTELLKETVGGPSFHKDITLDASLDESHAVAVGVTAEGEAKIWLVAARFE